MFDETVYHLAIPHAVDRKYLETMNVKYVLKQYTTLCGQSRHGYHNADNVLIKQEDSKFVQLRIWGNNVLNGLCIPCSLLALEYE